MTFVECVLACADNRELVTQFDRIYRTNLLGAGTPLDRMIDEATGRLDSDLGQFVAFVHEYVWLRCPEIQGEAAR